MSLFCKANKCPVSRCNDHEEELAQLLADLQAGQPVTLCGPGGTGFLAQGQGNLLQGEGNRLGNLGNAYRDLGQVEKAREYLSQALIIFEEIKSPTADRVRQWLDALG